MAAEVYKGNRYFLDHFSYIPAKQPRHLNNMAAVRAQDLTINTALVAYRGYALNKTCSICLDELGSSHEESQDAEQPKADNEKVNKEIVQAKICSHIFHRDCIEDWFRLSNGPQQNSCPNCRAVLFGQALVHRAPQDQSLWDVPMQDENGLPLRRIVYDLAPLIRRRRSERVMAPTLNRENAFTAANRITVHIEHPLDADSSLDQEVPEQVPRG